ncbi:MAG TPA: hypothetical protein VKD90_13375 [Gemmataceae bacterium]|nr:hypothetical protein [Gemmataceae bacterium]
MSLPPDADRPTYQRSGRVAWPRFLPAALGTLVVAGGMAYVWFLAYDAGWGYWLATPVVLALPIALAAYLAVGFGRCRNRWVAGVLGAVAAVVYHAGYFHADLVRVHGPPALTRIELLPEFIGDRMANDGVRVQNQVLPRSEAYNWFYSAVELLVLNLLIAGAAVYRSLFAYCEACGRWMRSVALRAEAGASYQIADALADGDPAAVPDVVGTGLAFRPVYAWLEFEYCPAAREPGHSCPAYLTLKEFRGGTEHPDVLMYQGRLTPAELDALADRVAALAFLRVSAPAPAVDQPVPGRSLDRHAGSVAAVERLPADAGGADLDRAGKIELVLALTPIAALLAGIGLFVWGFVRAPWEDPGPDAGFGYGLLVIGLILGSVGGLMVWTNVDYLGMRHAYRHLCDRIAQRADALVSGEGPDARFVEVVPRAHWHQVIPDKPADRGLLRLDRAGGRLLFEGLKERYVIPADAVVGCVVEPILPHTGNWNIYVLVLTVRYPADAPGSLTGGRRGDAWEVPLLPRPTEFHRYNSSCRRALAEELRAEVDEVTSDE